MFSTALINKHLDRKTDDKVIEQRPSMLDLVFELTGGVKRVWPRSGQLPCSDLSVKYALLHKISVENCCPSHKSGLSTSLASLLYQNGIGSSFNYGVFILNQVTRHIGSQAVKIPLCFPRLICGMILAQHPNIQLLSEVPGFVPPTLSFNYKLYQGKHVPDLMHTDQPEIDAEPSQIDTSCGKKTIHILDNESKKLGLLIQRLSMRKTEIDEMQQLLRGSSVHTDGGSGDA